MVTGKADSLELLEGMSPVGAMENGRTPPTTASGACVERGSLGTREGRQLLVRETEIGAIGIEEGLVQGGGLPPACKRRTNGRLAR